MNTNCEDHKLLRKLKYHQLPLTLKRLNNTDSDQNFYRLTFLSQLMVNFSYSCSALLMYELTHTKTAPSASLLFSVTCGSNHQAFVSSQVPPPDGSIMKLQRERVGRLSIKMRLEYILSILRKRGLLQTRQNKLGSAVCLLKLSLNWRYKKYTVERAYCGNTKSVALFITEWIQINIEHYTTETGVQGKKRGWSAR